MADLEEKVADLGEKAIGFASNLFKRGTEVVRQQAGIVGLQTQIVRLKEDKARLYSLMGQKVYALYEKGLVKNADLLALCDQAKDLDNQVEAAEQEILQLRSGTEAKTEVHDTEGGIEAEPAPPTAPMEGAIVTPSPPPAPPTEPASWPPPPSPEPPTAAEE